MASVPEWRSHSSRYAHSSYLSQINTKVPIGELPKKHGVIVVQHTDLQVHDGRPPNTAFWEAATQHLIGAFNMMLPRSTGAPTVGIVASGPWFIVIEEKKTLFDKSFVHIPVKSSKGGHAAHVVDDGDALAQFIHDTIQKFEASLPKYES